MTSEPPPERAEGAAVPGPSTVVGAGRRRLVRAMWPRASRAQLLAGFLCAVLGFALVTQVRQTQGEGYASLRSSDLVRILTGLNDESARLEAESRRLETVRADLTSGSDTSAAAEEAARERLEVLGVLAGTAPATGPGIELRIDDPDGAVTAAILLDTLQELRDAGAEAVQLGPVRVVASTSLVDADGGVLVAGAVLRPPYRFLVIGDPQTLAAALDIPGGVLEVLRQEGANGTVTRLGTIQVDALQTLPSPEYARPAPAPSP